MCIILENMKIALLFAMVLLDRITIKNLPEKQTNFSFPLKHEHSSGGQTQAVFISVSCLKEVAQRTHKYLDVAGFSYET